MLEIYGMRNFFFLIDGIFLFKYINVYLRVIYFKFNIRF